MDQRQLRLCGSVYFVVHQLTNPMRYRLSSIEAERGWRYAMFSSHAAMPRCYADKINTFSLYKLNSVAHHPVCCHLSELECESTQLIYPGGQQFLEFYTKLVMLYAQFIMVGIARKRFGFQQRVYRSSHLRPDFRTRHKAGLTDRRPNANVSVIWANSKRAHSTPQVLLIFLLAWPFWIQLIHFIHNGLFRVI